MQTPLAVEAVELGKYIENGLGTHEGRLDILRDLNLQVSSGERIAIIGSSGSGKSTLLALLAGLDSPSAGKVRISGTEISSLDEDGRAALRGRSMGFVFQSFQLMPALTALENVMLPLQLAGRKDAKERALSALERVGLGQRLGHYPRQMSGGEQQRVAIARAFAPQPAILFADEPTGNLDEHTGERIVELLFGLNAEAGTTLVLVTHDMTLARRCQRVLRLHEGQLQQEEPSA
ncbi:MAG: ABC transporter ATP-binding protein [Methylobacillus glycogenes]|nr:ABC transporter ATP-binding protein [Methylobacillus glycogenes]